MKKISYVTFKLWGNKKKRRRTIEQFLESDQLTKQIFMPKHIIRQLVIETYPGTRIKVMAISEST